MGLHLLIGRILVGGIWGVWHIPYYLALVDPSVLASYTSHSHAVFITLVVFGLVIAEILFGELRLMTGSVWPVVIMHSMSNIIILTLLTSGFVRVKESTELFFTPSWEGLVGAILIAAAGILMYRRRIRNVQPSS